MGRPAMPTHRLRELTLGMAGPPKAIYRSKATDQNFSAVFHRYNEKIEIEMQQKDPRQ